MRCCLIAIFALYMLLSGSAFAVEGGHSASATQGSTFSTLQLASAGPEATAQQVKALNESPVNHVAMDHVPDLPDSLLRFAWLQRPVGDGSRTIGYRQRAVLPPSLDRLLRPPQRFASAS